MLLTLRNVPKESRVLAVVVVTLLVQVLVLSLFGLAALRGQVAEREQALREISRRVLERNLVQEVVRLVSEAEERARAALSGLPVEVPRRDPTLHAALGDLLEREALFRHAFLVGPAGDWMDPEGRTLWPAPGTSRPAGGDAANPFAAIEAAVEGGADPALALEQVRAAAEGQPERWQPEALRLIARLAMRAGRPDTALAAWDRLAAEYPQFRDDTVWPPLPFAPSAARHALQIRLEKYRAGRSGAAEIARGFATYRSLLAANRFQMSDSYRDWEDAKFTSLYEEAGTLLPVADRVRLAAAVRAVEERERAFLAARRGFAAAIARQARGAEPGGHLLGRPADGVWFSIALTGPAGPAGAAVFEVDVAEIRTRILPGILAGLPLPRGVAATVRTEEGEAVAGPTPPPGRILASARLGRVLPFWQADVFLEDPEVLSREIADARRLHYGVMGLSIAGMLAAGWFLFRTVRKEIRLARLKSDFLSNVTHELKTPLTSIRMFVEMLEDGRARGEEERRECLSVISRETDRLSGLIQRVLDLARFEGRREHALSVRRTDVAELVRETVTVFRRRLAAGEAQIRVELPGELPACELDPEAVGEALLNLLSNAVKYGGREIAVSAGVREGRLRIQVADDGIGIAESEQAKVFEKFYRAEDHLARDVEGSGLGLALVREVARAHGGRVTLKSRPGEGSRFTIELPGPEERK